MTTHPAAVVTPTSDEVNPGFTLFANDILHLEPICWISDAQLGQVFRLIVYSCKLGSRLPKDHPLLGLIDPKIVSLCTVAEGDHLAVVRPVDLPKLMLARQQYLNARREAGAKGGRRTSALRQRRAHAAA